CSMPSEQRLQELTTFCRVAGVGFMGVSDEVRDPEEPGNINPRLNWVRYMEEVRCRVAMFMEFQKKFRDELRLAIRKDGAGNDWTSTDRPLDRPQWNATIHSGDAQCFLGVN